MKNSVFKTGRRLWLALVVALCACLPALAQNVTVTGTVLDPDGEPAVGASILVKGTSTGVSSDIDGQFTLQCDPNAVLQVSYVGYETQLVELQGKTDVTITLKDSGVNLQELVVVGYGTVKKTDATGSVAVIKPDEIEASLSTSTQDLLVGASPGVVVTTNGGNPTGNGDIRIRGGSSLSASNDPLIVIDGVPQTNQGNAGGTNAMSMINPANIESMTILKDASATAIYGSRASNGVIIITTKKGRSGRPQVNFAANFSLNTARNSLHMMDGNQFRRLVTEQLGTDGALEQLGDANTNWQKAVMRTTFSQDYNLGVGGAAGWLPYRLNVSYTDNNGILKTSQMQRTTVGFNLSPKFFNGLLQVNANATGAYIKSRQADQGAVGAAVGFNPTLPVYGAYSPYYMRGGATVGNTGLRMFNGFTNTISSTGIQAPQVTKNPLELLMDRNNTGKVLSSTGNLQIDYALHFLPDLHLNLNLGYQVSKNTNADVTAANSFMAWDNGTLKTMGSAGAGTRSEWWQLQRNTMLNFYANYKKQFDAIRSNVDVMAGYEWQRFSYLEHSNTYINTLGFQTVDNVVPFDNGVWTLNYDPASEKNIGRAINDAPDVRYANHLQLLSFFGRVNYSFADTYLLTATLRDDASSRFSKDTRWGLFPSVALGWKISNMPFMEKASSWLNEWKLRMGWGITGQQDIGSNYFPYMPVYTISSNTGYQYPGYDGGWVNPLYPQAYDENIKWEETTTWNVGMDFSFLNNRVTVAADWYLRDTKDLINHAPAIGVNTSNYVTRNIGSLRNTGVELTVTAKPVVTEDFTWTTGFNYAWNKNKITELTSKGADATTPNSSRGIPTGTGGDLQWFVVGQAANTFRVYQQVYNNEGNPIPGQYVDQNADGKIDDKDLIMFHSPDPKVTLNWNNSFTYKNWDLGIVLRASFGNWVYNGPRYERTSLSRVDQYGLNNVISGEFLFPNQKDAQSVLSDYFVENASFVRCDNITLGYTIPSLFKDQGRLRLYGAVQNPFVITKYKGLDPEVFSGIDNNCYPRPITFTFGLIATF